VGQFKSPQLRKIYLQVLESKKTFKLEFGILKKPGPGSECWPGGTLTVNSRSWLLQKTGKRVPDPFQFLLNNLTKKYHPIVFNLSFLNRTKLREMRSQIIPSCVIANSTTENFSKQKIETQKIPQKNKLLFSPIIIRLITILNNNFILFINCFWIITVIFSFVVCCLIILKIIFKLIERWGENGGKKVKNEEKSIP